MASTQDVPARASSVMTASTSSAAAAAPSAHPPTASGNSEHKTGGFVVGLIVGAVVFATVMMVSFIWYRWNGVQEPTTAVIVQGDESLAGTVITVAAPGRRPIRTSLDKSKGYTAPVLVVPGRYRVTAEREGVLLLRQDVEVKRFLAVQFDLSGMAKQLGNGGGGAGPTTGPNADASLPEAGAANP